MRVRVRHPLCTVASGLIKAFQHSLTPNGTNRTVNHGPPPLVTWLLLSLEFDAAGWPLGTAVADTSLLTLAVTAEGWGGAKGGGILGEGFGGGRGGRGGGGGGGE